MSDVTNVHFNSLQGNVELDFNCDTSNSVIIWPHDNGKVSFEYSIWDYEVSLFLFMLNALLLF